MPTTFGKLVRWTHDDGTVFTTLEQLLAFRSPRNLRGEVDMVYMDQLADVAEHWGQRCELVEKDSTTQPALFLVRFDDGFELYAWLGDVVFD